MTSICTHLQTSTYARVPAQRLTQKLCMPRDLNPECLLTARKTIRWGKLCCSSRTCSLQIHRTCQVLSLLLETYLIPCHFPRDPCFHLRHFISSLCPMPPSSFIPSFLLFLNLPEVVEYLEREFFFSFWPWIRWNLSFLTRDQTCTPCIGES